MYSEADAEAPHVRQADAAVAIGPGPAAESYLRIDAIVGAARATGAEAVHPGYGFLSENPDFALACEAADLAWIGPSPAAMRSMADKLEARSLVHAAGVPVVPGTEGPVDARAAAEAANELNFPLMVKAARGGGGIGMTVVRDHEQLAAALATATARAAAAFGDASIFLERYVQSPRHIEVQVFGEADGRVIHLRERECSVQRRHQKVIEEAPSMALDEALRDELCAAAVRAAEAVGYRSAGTVEFIFDGVDRRFYFLEMNTRLQVEHPVTEAVMGVDLAVAQLRAAAGEPSGIEAPTPHGHAIEFRVYAEDPVRFLPSPGLLEVWEEPAGEGVRVDSGVAAGYRVSHFYDPLLAKLVVHAGTREDTIERSIQALGAFRIEGVKHNIPAHLEVLRSPEFRSGDYDTGLLDLIAERRRQAATA